MQQMGKVHSLSAGFFEHFFQDVVNYQFPKHLLYLGWKTVKYPKHHLKLKGWLQLTSDVTLHCHTGFEKSVPEKATVLVFFWWKITYVSLWCDCKATRSAKLICLMWNISPPTSCPYLTKLYYDKLVWLVPSCRHWVQRQLCMWWSNSCQCPCRFLALLPRVAAGLLSTLDNHSFIRKFCINGSASWLPVSWSAVVYWNFGLDHPYTILIGECVIWRLEMSAGHTG